MTTDVAGWSRVPAILNFPDTAGFAETYGFGAARVGYGSKASAWCRAARIKDAHLFMHPSSTLHLLPMPAALADAGFHVLCAASRYPKNDSGLIMEKVAIDRGAGSGRPRPRLRNGDPRRLVGRRLALTILPGRGRSAVDRRDAGGRP